MNENEYTRINHEDGRIEFIPKSEDQYKELKEALARGENIWYLPVGYPNWIKLKGADFTYDVKCYSLTDPTPKDKDWLPETNEYYYLVDNDGTVVGGINDGHAVDRERIDFNNVFRTQAEAEKAAEMQKRSNAIIRACLLVDPDYVPDWSSSWSSSCTEKYRVTLKTKSDDRYWTWDSSKTYQMSPAYVSTKEKAQEVCELLTKWEIK